MPRSSPTCARSWLFATRAIRKTEIEAGLATAFGCTIQGIVPGGRHGADGGDHGGCGVDTIGLADTVGVANPAQIRRVFKRVRAEVGGKCSSAHLHNTRGQGLANVVAALDAGVTRVQFVAGRHRRLSVCAGRDRQYRHRGSGVSAGGDGARTGIDIEKLIAARASAGEGSAGRDALRPRAGCGPAEGLRAGVGGSPRDGKPLPLDGVRVVEFSHMVMGPSSGLVLADLGADVIKVEPTGSGDNTRRLPGAGAGFFITFNRNKRSLALDIKAPKGLAFAKRLIARADVLTENFRPPSTAMKLAEDGRLVTVAEVAAAAGVSRATAYRYFGSRGQLISAIVGESLGPVRSLESRKVDGRERLQELFTKTFPRFRQFEPHMRAALQLSLEHWALERSGRIDEEPYRRGHRVAILSRAAAPLKSKMPPSEYRRLLCALSLIFGIEPYVVLKDIWGCSDREVQATTRWVADALIDAALKGRAGARPQACPAAQCPIFLAAEVLREEPLHRLVELEPVLLVVEAVALVVLDHVLDLDAALLQRLDHLVAFGLCNARILGALRDQQRRLDLVGVNTGEAAFSSALSFSGCRRPSRATSPDRASSTAGSSS